MAAKLSPEETRRYARHLVLKGMGGAGQQKLKAARALVIGAGGLGSPVIAYLAAAGIGMLGVIDDDEVALSNLQRQIVHGMGDLGRSKAASVGDFVASLNPHVAFRAQVEPFVPAIGDAIHQAVSIATASTFVVGVAASPLAALLVMGLKEVPMRAEEPAGTADRRPERVAADRLCDCVRSRRINVANGDLHPLGSQRQCYRAANARGAAGDDRLLSFKFSKLRMCHEPYLRPKQHGDHIATKTYKSIEIYV